MSTDLTDETNSRMLAIEQAALRSRGNGLLRRHGIRFASFSMIGGGIFVLGLALQAILTGEWHVASLISYIVQAIVSVELSFFLNRRLTWSKAGTPFWGAFWRFNAQKVVTITINLILYALLLKLGINYLIANVLLTVVFTFVNYVGADRFVFLRRSEADPPAGPAADALAADTPAMDTLTVDTLTVDTLTVNVLAAPVLADFRPVPEDQRQVDPLPQAARRDQPAISVVIPCRANEGTIRAAVDSILGQDYPMLRELILVGSPGDSTWQALEDLTDSRLQLVETETPPGIRDANFKRDFGIRQSAGDLVCLIDSDMVIPADWMSSAVSLLSGGGSDCVAGVMRSIRNDFWGRFVDRSVLGAKTPRVAGSYLVTAADFGRRGHKPPITANILFNRALYEACPIDSSWSHGSLEDYEWFWRVAESGHQVLVSNQLYGWHHHRAGFGKLTAEYRRSARGCAYFIRAHRRSPFARKRLTQAIALPLIALILLLGLAVVTALGYGPQAAVAVAVAAVSGLGYLSGREVIRNRTMESLLYPLPGLILGLNYLASLDTHLTRNVPVRSFLTLRQANDRAGAASGHIRWQGTAGPRGPMSGRVLALFAATVAAGLALRLWHLEVSPAWQWDEAVYWRVSANVQHGWLTEHPVYGLPYEPFLYQPPFFVKIESWWFDLVGASIYHARLLGVGCTVVMQVLLVRLLSRLHGPRIALLAVIPVIFDGWLLYIERVSYIENALMILVVLGFLLYQRALDRPHWGRFLIAGAALGAAASFKQTGAYVVVVVVVCWLITRREHRGHLVLLGGAIGVIAAYLVLMILKYDPPGNPWFLHQSMVQVRRVLGLQQSGGTLTSAGGALHLLAQQYKYFIPSLVPAGGAILIALRRTWQCLRTRSWAPVRDNVLLYSWLVTGAVVFGSSSLKFPQYFVLILLPAYCYFWTELARCDWRPLWQRGVPAAAAVIGIGAFALTVPAFSDNSLAKVQSYAARDIPASAIVVTEQSIGDLISQRWCTVEKANACLGHATYAITWHTYLQSSVKEGDAAFHQLMLGATRVTSFRGSVGTATVWKLAAAAGVPARARVSAHAGVATSKAEFIHREDRTR